MSYAALTRADPNPLKRWLQRRRLRDALGAIRAPTPAVVVDYGGGDGELLRLAAQIWPDARLICFEPVASLAEEARINLAGLGAAEVVCAEADLPAGVADVVFCTEVFEHLPAPETDAALAEIHRVLTPGGRLVVGVPMELWGPALAKGLFRMARRPGSFDGRVRHILAAAGGQAPAPRPEVEISPGRAYFPHHLGFDHRRLLTAMRGRFDVERVWGSPAAAAPPWLNSEVYVLARKREAQ
ncbi:MAG: class I SAM-dependent methyltransferase [Caulobacteraceae bacterium]